MRAGSPHRAAPIGGAPQAPAPAASVPTAAGPRAGRSSARHIASLDGAVRGSAPQPRRTEAPRAPAPKIVQINAAQTDQLLGAAQYAVAAANEVLAPYWQAQTQINMGGTRLSGRRMDPRSLDFFRKTAALLGKVSVFMSALEAARQGGAGAVVADADLAAVEDLQTAADRAPQVGIV